jgi:putative endonuclease
MNKTSDVLPKTRYYAYVLFSLKDFNLYVGFTTDLKQRFSEHTKGNVTSTKNRLPLKLIHYEYFVDEADAKSREKFLKSGFGRDQLKQVLKRTLTGLSYKNLILQSVRQNEARRTEA